MGSVKLGGASGAWEGQAEVDFAAVVRFLCENLGPTVTSYMAGATQATVDGWAHQRQTPHSSPGQRRLRGRTMCAYCFMIKSPVLQFGHGLWG